MLAFPKIRITAKDQRDTYRSHTLGSIYGHKLIIALGTDILIAALDTRSGAHGEISQRIGPSTNPHWVVARVAEELCFGRDKLTVQQFDVITSI